MGVPYQTVRANTNPEVCRHTLSPSWTSHRTALVAMWDQEDAVQDYKVLRL